MSNQKKPINRITEADLETFRNTRTLVAYQACATQSAFYPGQGTDLGLIYCALKVNGEAGELAEHIGKALRDDDMLPISGGDDGRRGDVPCIYLEDSTLTAQRHTLLVKEVGDVLWYLAAICNELGITLNQAAEANLVKLYNRGLEGTLQGSGDNR